MNENINVSVIIPVYNVEKYLAECLDSVCGQTLADTEIICVDDGSTDGSGRILEEYAKKDSRIQIITKENGGQSAARNIGIKKSKGEYLYFMDSDDILQKDALLHLYNRAKQDQLDTIYCDGESFALEGECQKQVELYTDFYTRKNAYPGVYKGYELMISMFKNGEYRVSPCLQMVRREHFIENNCWFYEGIVHEDNLFNFVCLLQAKRSGYIHESLYLRRIRPDSVMTANTSYKRVYGYLKCYIEMTEFLKNSEYSQQRDLWDLVHSVLKLTRGTYDDMLKSGNALGEMNEYEAAIFRMCVIDYMQQFWIVRKKSKFKRGLQCFKDNGLGYTTKKVLQKVKNKISK